MANREKGEVDLTIAGRTYTLVMNTDAMARLETLFSTPSREVMFAEVTDRMLKGSVRAIRGFVWAALQAHHPDVTLEHASGLIDAAGGLPGLTAILEEAVKATTPDADDLQALGVPANPRKAQRKGRGRGGISTSTRAVSA